MTAYRKLLWPLYRRRASVLLGALALSVLTVAAGVGLLGVSGWFLTAAWLAGPGVYFNLFVPSSLVRGLSFLRIASRYAERLVGHAATLRLLADLRGQVFGALVRLTPRQLARYRGGDLVARLTGDVDALDTVFLLGIAPLATALLGGAIYVAVLGMWLPAAAWGVGGVLLLVVVAVPAWLQRASRRPGAAIQASGAALRGAVIETVEAHADLAALDAGGPAQARFQALCGQVSAARRAQAGIAARGMWLVQAGAGLALLSVLWFGLDGLARQRVSGPLLAGLLLATLGIFEVAGPIMRGASRLGAAAAAARRVDEIVRMEPDLRDPDTPRPLPGQGVLEARGLVYAYPGHEALRVLDGATLSLAPGERVAILGASGSGKSTLLHLLMRLDDPGAGQVRYGGCDVRDCAQAELHRRIALLSQDSPVFLGTVRTNLLIGRADADDAALWAALDAARLGGFVRSLPDGLDTWVGETGAGLSAGQARRLCLARVLLAPASIVLLDEPTAGLDADTEADFLRDLGQALHGRAALIATHADLPPGTAHRVLWMRDGRLIGPVQGVRTETYPALA